MSDRSFILHPAGQSFGPFDLDFIRTKFAEGAVAPTTGVTILVGGLETRYTTVGDLLREEIEENAELPGTPSTQTWHPDEPEVVGNTGPRGDYTDVWRFPCCGAQVASDATPPSSPGCQTSPASVVDDVIDRIRTFHPEILKTAPAATGQEKIEPIPTPEETKPPESELPFAWKNHWFLERYLGGLAAEVRCPDCGWTDIWYVRDETPLEHCPQCQYAGSDIPLSTFKGTLKFHNPDVLTAEWIAVIEFCCPGFLSVRASDEALAIRERRMSKTVTHLAHVPLEESRGRRWAGDNRIGLFKGRRLSRRSYFGVCSSADGDDRGGVAMELCAYRSPRLCGRVSIYDLFYAGNAEELCLPKSHSFVFIFDQQRFRDRGGPELKNIQTVCLNDRRIGVVIPYQIKQVSIDRVLDLRRREAQDWLFQTFHNGYKGFWLKPLSGELANFFSMFPTFYDPAHGGAEETQTIGYWLRMHGVNALIYPSARCNTGLVSNGDEPVEWYGWNLVDYRSSSIPSAKDGIQMDLSPWSRTVPLGYGLRFGEQSWVMAGVQEAQERAWEKHLLIAEKEFVAGRSWYLERYDSHSSEWEALCVNMFCEWRCRGPSLAGLPDACPSCGTTRAAPSHRYTEFGEFLNEVRDAAIADFELDAKRVCPAMDWLLDRGHFAEYSSKCALGQACTEIDVHEAALFVARFLKDGDAN